MTKENNKETVGYRHPPEDTQWKPGQSGNPKGRPPKNLSITSLVKEMLEQEGEQSKTNAELIAEAIIELAKKKDLHAIKELLDRIEGKVTDKHRIETDIPVKLVFVPAQQLIEEEKRRQLTESKN